MTLARGIEPPAAGRLDPAAPAAAAVAWLRRTVLPARAGRRWAQLVAGCVVLGAGVAAMVASRFGADAFGVCIGGAARASGVSFGTANAVLGLSLIVAWSTLGRLRPGPGSLVNPVIVGVAINLTLPPLTHLAAPAGVGPRTLLFAAGLVLMCVGAGVYLGAGLGAGPIDGSALALANRGLALARAYQILLVACLVSGALLGGPWGLGTVAAAVLAGPGISATLRRAAVPAA